MICGTPDTEDMRRGDFIGTCKIQISLRKSNILASRSVVLPLRILSWCCYIDGYLCVFLGRSSVGSINSHNKLSLAWSQMNYFGNNFHKFIFLHESQLYLHCRAQDFWLEHVYDIVTGRGHRTRGLIEPRTYINCFNLYIYLPPPVFGLHLNYVP